MEAPVSEEISPVPEAVEPAATATGQTEPAEHPENNAESTGGFREPHPEAPAEFASHEPESVEPPEYEPVEEIHAVPEPAQASEPTHEQPRDRQPVRRPEPQRPRQWSRPADFRPAEASAISQAVEHATEIAESLKRMIDQLDEVLELVEIAERQKVADEREIEELRRALRRIQPPRRELLHQQASRGPRRDEPRREPREQSQRREDPPPQRAPETPAESPNPES